MNFSFGNVKAAMLAKKKHCVVTAYLKSGYISIHTNIHTHRNTCTQEATMSDSNELSHLSPNMLVSLNSY